MVSLFQVSLQRTLSLHLSTRAPHWNYRDGMARAWNSALKPLEMVEYFCINPVIQDSGPVLSYLFNSFTVSVRQSIKFNVIEMHPSLYGRQDIILYDFEVRPCSYYRREFPNSIARVVVQKHFTFLGQKDWPIHFDFEVMWRSKTYFFLKSSVKSCTTQIVVLSGFSQTASNTTFL